MLQHYYDDVKLILLLYVCKHTHLYKCLTTDVQKHMVKSFNQYAVMRHHHLPCLFMHYFCQMLKTNLNF